MRVHRAYLLGCLLGCGLALPLLALAAGMRVPTVVATAPQKSVTDVNRALKGDRLPIIAPAGSASTTPGVGTPSPRMPDGCEASVSAMTRSPLARTPARCVS